MRLSIGFLHSFSLRHVKRARKVHNNKGGKSLRTVKLMPPWCFKARPFTSACFQSIAVTFGTATSSSIDAGCTTEIRSSLFFTFR